ncbi:unnamed protein product [Boreogadus saida]
MDPRALGPLLLLAGLLLLSGLCGGVPSLYTIDAVGLSVLPGPSVPSGTPVTLTCSVSVSHDSARRLTHVFRFTRFDALVLAVNSTAGEARLRLLPARAADSGDYECQVEVMEKVRHSGGQRLTVTGLQTPVLSLSAAVVYEGGQLAASCSAPQEKGALVFQFFQRPFGGGASLLKHAISTGNRSEARLVLREVGDRDLFCNYSIPMAPAAGGSNSSNTLHVLVKALFISPVMVVLPASSVFEGDVVEVVCRVVEPPGSVDVYLTKGRKVLKRSATVLHHRFTAAEGDGGEYVCKAEYGAAQKETYQTIRVKEPVCGVGGNRGDHCHGNYFWAQRGGGSATHDSCGVEGSKGHPVGEPGSRVTQWESRGTQWESRGPGSPSGRAGVQGGGRSPDQSQYTSRSPDQSQYTSLWIRECPVSRSASLLVLSQRHLCRLSRRRYLDRMSAPGAPLTSHSPALDNTPTARSHTGPQGDGPRDHSERTRGETRRPGGPHGTPSSKGPAAAEGGGASLHAATSNRKGEEPLCTPIPATGRD